MINNQWYAVLSSSEVPSSGLLGFVRLGEKLVFWRDEFDEVACIADQ